MPSVRQTTITNNNSRYKEVMVLIYKFHSQMITFEWKGVKRGCIDKEEYSKYM